MILYLGSKNSSCSVIFRVKAVLKRTVVGVLIFLGFYEDVYRQVTTSRKKIAM